MPKNIFEKLKDLFTTQNTKLTSIASKLEELEIGKGGGVGQVDATPGATYHGEIFNQYTGIDTNQATGMNTHAEGYSTIASGHFSHAEGQQNLIFATNGGDHAHVEGTNCVIGQVPSDYINQIPDTNNAYSGLTSVGTAGTTCHTEGERNRCWAYYSHVEGSMNVIHGVDANHVEGYSNVLGAGSTPDGNAVCDASLYPLKRNESCYFSHCEGAYNHLTGHTCHCEGYQNHAHGQWLHCEGYGNYASGQNSHTEGMKNENHGYCSHVEGDNNISNEDYQHVQGTYNVEDSNMKMIIGNGKQILEDGHWVTHRKNIFTVDKTGNIQCGQSDTTGDFTGHYGTVNGVDLVQLAADVAAIKAQLGI